MDDDNEGGRILVGPEYLSEGRLADKGIETPYDDEEDNFNDKEDNRANEREILKRPVVVEDERDENENHKYFENPYGSAEYGKYPLFPVTQDRYNYLQQNPFFLPPNSYVPIPLANQYLQRRAFNAAAMRYPQIMSPYPSYGGYGQEANASPPYSPFRVFYAQ